MIHSVLHCARSHADEEAEIETAERMGLGCDGQPHIREDENE